MRKKQGFTLSVIPAPHRSAGLTPAGIQAEPLVIPAKAGIQAEPLVIPAKAGIQTKNKKGFTLIELLVVIAIIALLLSILTPALNSVKERAKRILCLNALRQWGIAITAYNAANDNLMFIPRRWGGVPFPHYMAALPPRFYGTPVATQDMKSGEFSVYAIHPYIDCVGKGFEDTGIGSDIFACPNCSGDFMVEWVWACWDAFCRPNDDGSFSNNEYFIEPAYSYWVVGGTDPPIDVGNESSDNVLRDLTIDTLSPKRLLMSEVICYDFDYGQVSFRYNHGRGGWAWCLDWADVKAPGGHVVFDGEQDATGRSQLFGDGHVQWRDISLKFEDNIPSEITEKGGVGFAENEWNGPGSGWLGAFNSYY